MLSSLLRFGAHRLVFFKLSNGGAVHFVDRFLVILPQLERPPRLREAEPQDEDQLGLIVQGNPAAMPGVNQAARTFLLPELVDEAQLTGGKCLGMMSELGHDS